MVKIVPSLPRAQWERVALLLLPLAVFADRLVNVRFPTGVKDLYPLYYGARALLETGNAYNVAQVAPDTPLDGLSAVGNVYPLPLVLLMTPLMLLPAVAAAAMFRAACMLAIGYAIKRLGLSWWLLAYIPLVQALDLEQYGLAMAAAGLTMVWAERDGNRWAWVAAAVFAALKPPALLPLIAWHLWRHRSWLLPWAAAVSGLTAVAFALQPGWVSAWLHVVHDRGDVVGNTNMNLLVVVLPALLLLAAQRDWTGTLVLAGLLVTPWQVSGVYVAALLLIGVRSRLSCWWLVACALLWVPGYPFTEIGPSILSDGARQALLALTLPRAVTPLLDRLSAARQAGQPWRTALPWPSPAGTVPASN